MQIADVERWGLEDGAGLYTDVTPDERPDEEAQRLLEVCSTQQRSRAYPLTLTHSHSLSLILTHSPSLTLTHSHPLSLFGYSQPAGNAFEPESDPVFKLNWKWLRYSLISGHRGDAFGAIPRSFSLGLANFSEVGMRGVPICELSGGEEPEKNRNASLPR